MRALSIVVLLLALSAGSVFGATLKVTVLDDTGRPLPDAAVILESPEAKRGLKPLVNVEVEQKDRSFLPGLLIIPTGTAVSFPNRDSVRHHVYSFSPTKRFELKLYVGTPANPVVFDQAGVVVMGCNIHDQMIATILVVDTPFYGTSAIDGIVTLPDVPTGAYSLKVWHNRLPPGKTLQSRPVKLGTADTAIQIQLKELRPE